MYIYIYVCICMYIYMYLSVENELGVTWHYTAIGIKNMYSEKQTQPLICLFILHQYKIIFKQTSFLFAGVDHYLLNVA